MHSQKRPSPRPCLRAAALLVLFGCSVDERPEPRVLRLELTLPRQEQELLLNEPLDFYFSADIDRTSVPQAFRIRRHTGERARGRFEVEGHHVRFVPAAVLATDLSDGGFQLASTYTVSIAGFPAADALRGSAGEPLERRQVFDFRTVRLTDGGGRVFADESPERAAPLYLLTDRIGPEDSLYFLCREEPLDPLSLQGAEFYLQSRTAGGERQAPVALDVRLVESFRSEPGRLNRNLLPYLESDEYGEFHIDPERAALLELTPKRLLAKGAYGLISPRETPLLDRGGNHVPIITPDRHRQIAVLESVGAEWGGELLETFLDSSLLSPVAVPGYDGTAHWDEMGRITLRLPAAAGDGTLGRVRLAGEEERMDLHTTRLDLPAGTTCRLSAAPGLVVLRSQGAMHLSGKLLRELGESAFRESSPRRASRFGIPHSGAGTLTNWLARIKGDTSPGWTVLVAGGDLVIDGEVRVETPLLLVAGGVVRVTGVARSQPDSDIYILSRGGGMGLDISTLKANLELDVSHRNLLREPLRVAAISAPIPPRGRVRRWLSARIDGWPPEPGLAHCGWRVRYLPEQQPPPGEPLQPVDHPWLVPEKDAIRLLIELWGEPRRGFFPWKPPLGAGVVFLEWVSRWKPPFVDTIHLKWQ